MTRELGNTCKQSPADLQQRMTPAAMFVGVWHRVVLGSRDQDHELTRPRLQDQILLVWDRPCNKTTKFQNSQTGDAGHCPQTRGKNVTARGVATFSALGGRAMIWGAYDSK